MIWDDGATGIVGPSLHEVRANPNLSAPGITSAERVSATAEADVVSKPAYHCHRGGGDDGAGRDSPSDDMVTAESHQQRRRPAVVAAARNPTVMSAAVSTRVVNRSNIRIAK